MGLSLNSNDLLKAAIASLKTSSKKLGLSESDPLVQGLVQKIEKTKICAEQTYSFKNGTDKISATFAKEGKLTRLEIEKEQVVQTKRARAIIAAAAASSVAVVGAIATLAVVQVATLPSLYDTACKIVPTAAKIVGGISGLAGVCAFFVCPRSGKFKSLKIEENKTSTYQSDFTFPSFKYK